jgi:hypothetical protein
MKIEKIFDDLIYEGILNEERYTDFFEFMAQGARKMTQGSAQYVYRLGDNSMNKNLVTPEGKVPNPMYDKIYKHCFFKFNWEDTFEEAKRRMGITTEPGEVRGEYEKIENFKTLWTGKNGVYFPIIPTGSESKYAVLEGNKFVELPKEEAYKYLKGRSNSTSTKPPYKNLIVNSNDKTRQIVRIAAGKNEWINPDFRLNYIGPTGF